MLAIAVRCCEAVPFSHINISSLLFRALLMHINANYLLAKDLSYPPV